MSKNTEKPQEQKQAAPATPALTRQQWDTLARWAWMEIRGTPGYNSLSPAQRSERIAAHADEMALDPHYQRLVGFNQPAAQEPRETAKPAAESGKTTERQKEQEPMPEKRSFDRNEWLGLSPTQIMQKLVKTGLVTDATNPGHGLEIIHTSHRHAHDYEGEGS